MGTGQIADTRAPASWRGPTDATGLRRRLPLATRADLVESLDAGPVDRDEMERNLADLARLARLPGGTSASVAAVAHLAGRRPTVSVLDVGAGRGDMALAFARRGWRAVALDSHAEVLDAARRVARDPLVEIVKGDARTLPYADDAFDVGHSSLLIHHLDPPDALAVLGELSRVSRLGVVVNDLRRGILAFVATGVTVAVLGRCRATRVDGVISARRAYTLAELDDLLAAAGLEPTWRSPGILPRVATAARRSP